MPDASVVAQVERSQVIARVRAHSGHVELHASTLPNIHAAMLTPHEAREIAEALDSAANMAERGETSGVPRA